ncbi:MULTISPECIES: ROK family protein [Chitinophagaceae]
MGVSKWDNLAGIDSVWKARIVRQLYFENRLSCLDLSVALGKSVPVVTKLVNELMTAGWLEEAGQAPSSGGRRPMLYSLKKKDCYIVAVAMTRMGMNVCLWDIQNQLVVAPEYFDLDLTKDSKAVDMIIEKINTVIQKSKVAHADILGVGISMPGFIDVIKGVNYSYLEMPDGPSLREYLSEKIRLPVYIDNDSSVLALAELRFGQAAGRREVMVINIGWGVGLGMIVDGKLFRGYSGFAGELSHIPISDSDKLCSCGKRGCLEVEATLLVATRQAIAQIRSGKMTGIKTTDNLYEMSERLMQAANKGNQDAIGIFSEMGYKIGKALAILIHIQNPELIILSGRGAAIGRLLLAPIQQALNKYCIPRLYKNTQLNVSQLGKNNALIGAGALVMEYFK